MNFSVVILTYNREKGLRDCLTSILKQTLLPFEVLIIDDGDLPMEFLRETKKGFDDKKIKFIYYKKNHKEERRGLSESKNIALNLINNDIFFILDDDLIIDYNFFEKITRDWKSNDDPNLIGIGGIIKNNRKKRNLEEIYNKIFGLTSKYKWDINNIGFQVWDEEIIKKEKGYYAHGGVCSYKKSLIKKIGNFSVFDGGRTALEDVDFCLRAKNKGYYLIIEPKAGVTHNHKSLKRESSFLMGVKEGHNRKIIFQNNCKKNFRNYTWFCWANTGWILRQFLTGNFLKGFGMMGGFFNFNKND